MTRESVSTSVKWATPVGVPYEGRLRWNRERRLLGDLGVPESTKLGTARRGLKVPQIGLAVRNCGRRSFFGRLRRDSACRLLGELAIPFRTEEFPQTGQLRSAFVVPGGCGGRVRNANMGIVVWATSRRVWQKDGQAGTNRPRLIQVTLTVESAIITNVLPPDPAAIRRAIPPLAADHHQKPLGEKS